MHGRRGTRTEGQADRPPRLVTVGDERLGEEMLADDRFGAGVLVDGDEGVRQDEFEGLGTLGQFVDEACDIRVDGVGGIDLDDDLSRCGRGPDGDLRRRPPHPHVTHVFVDVPNVPPGSRPDHVPQERHQPGDLVSQCLASVILHPMVSSRRRRSYATKVLVRGTRTAAPGVAEDRVGMRLFRSWSEARGSHPRRSGRWCIPGRRSARRCAAPPNSPTPRRSRCRWRSPGARLRRRRG